MNAAIKIAASTASFASAASGVATDTHNHEAWLRLSEYLGAKLGLHFPKNRLADLRRNFAKASAEFGFADQVACIRWLLSPPKNPRELRSRTQVLARHFTIGETYFLRDRPALEAMESSILPALIRSRRITGNRRLRIWCAACCTGEEAYTLAMLVHRLLPDLAEWNVAITATDLNLDFLERAKEATYGEWSFRDAPAWLRANYFSRTEDGRYVVMPKIRSMVRFMPLNLVDAATDTLGGAVHPEILMMDVVFCRNVLMYFTPQNIEKAVALLDKSLVDGGWLAVGPGETAAVVHRNLRPVAFAGAVLLQKTDAAKQPANSTSDFPTQAAFPATAAISMAVAIESAPVLSKINSKVSVDPTAGELSLASERAEAFDARARACADSGDTLMALAHCDQWLLVDKLNPGAHYLRGIILLERHDAMAAEQSLQKAIYLDESFALAYLALGHAAALRGDAGRSEKHYAIARRLVDTLPPDAAVAGGDGLTAGQLSESLQAISKRSHTRGEI